MKGFPATSAVADTPKNEPTPGLRIEVVTLPADLEQDDIARIQTKLTQYAKDARRSTPADFTQAGIDATYINWLIETDERRREAQRKQTESPADLIVDMGNLTGARVDRIPLNADYEAMVEDLLGNFNHIVVQGIPPMTAIYALSQAFALVLGFGLRANMPWQTAQEILKQLMQSAKAASDAVRIVTTKQ